MRKASLDYPADRCLAHLNSTDSIEKRAPLSMGGPGTTLEVFLKQQQGALVKLRTGAGPLFRRKRALLVELFDIALDCRAVNVEPTGGLALGDTLSYGVHYL